MRPGSIIIDISCDEHGGVESSKPTTIEEPIYEESGVIHYAVDHTPTLLHRAASKSISAVLRRYIDDFGGSKTKPRAGRRNSYLPWRNSRFTNCAVSESEANADRRGWGLSRVTADGLGNGIPVKRHSHSLATRMTGQAVRLIDLPMLPLPVSPSLYLAGYYCSMIFVLGVVAFKAHSKYGQSSWPFRRFVEIWERTWSWIRLNCSSRHLQCLVGAAPRRRFLPAAVDLLFTRASAGIQVLLNSAADRRGTW